MKHASLVLFLALSVSLIAWAGLGPIALAEATPCTITVYGTVFHDRDGDDVQSLTGTVTMSRV